MKVLVLSATGCMGSGLVEALKDDPNHQISAFTRNPDSDAAKPIRDAGITIFKGDFSDKEALDKAFSSGFDAVFFTIFPDLTGGDNDIEQAENIIDAVKRYRVKQVLYGSVARTGTQESFDRAYANLPENSFLRVYWSKKWRIEELIRSSGADWTIIKPPNFIQNLVFPHYVAMMFPELPTTLTIKDATDPNHPQWWVDGSDTGRFAAEAVKNPGKFRNKDITIGTELLTMNDVVEKLRKATGKDVQLYKWPADEWEATKTHPMHSIKRGFSEFGYDPEGGNPTEYGFEFTPISKWLEDDKNKRGTWLAT
ncbi:hypothetical protein TWF569_005752 [Orbilia oligospora]|uniref:NmrA-like domain-containing protein n=1 Tax=Orbilia oligospora TaxID=2813651 RepID=A0A7C8J1K5_ORBOL|nr:hypothetical protein TWF102_002785 [Orbilia oligospora]KAF3085013.1 hypothetical protein TWF706_000602 [Orbilia oligospora]KAF3085014.1 hypothetical protein TWF706_000602 [Orbilia oligospora]KAF3098102.1 hypothetical protein TWF103_009201 [Orbilia oligospora]KAF3124396.1 hypothetical protein TWF594_002035 [Orbilia oligospora]